MFPIIAGALSAVNAITAQAVVNTTPITSAWIDTSNYANGNLLIILNSGAASTADTLDITVLENTANSGAGSAVPADALFDPATGLATTFAQVTDAGASFQVVGVKLERLARYLRVTATAAGGTISIPFSVQVVAPKKYVE